MGDPLIKGLTEVANTRPNDPVTYLATYLYNFANKSKNIAQEQVNNSTYNFDASNMYNSMIFQEPNVLIIPDRPEENIDNIENEIGDEDAGYPQSPGSDVPESAFSNPNRVIDYELTYNSRKNNLTKREIILFLQDEHGQSVIHFAAIRSYPNDGCSIYFKKAKLTLDSGTNCTGQPETWLNWQTSEKISTKSIVTWPIWQREVYSYKSSISDKNFREFLRSILIFVSIYNCR